MSVMTQADARRAFDPRTARSQEWVAALCAPDARRSDAIRGLHELMRRAAATYVNRLGSAQSLGHVRREEIIESTADAATVDVLNKLHTFEGRSRFTTWAYKFAILKVATEVRRVQWRQREFDLSSAPDIVDHRDSPHLTAEANALGEAIRAAIESNLTPHQRRVFTALVVDEIPIDVLADQLGSNRNALYKTLHDARRRLREDLVAQGLIEPATRVEVTR